MRRLPLLTLPLLAVIALAACTSGSQPGWTYAPAPSSTPAASGAPSGEPSGAPSAAPSAAGSPAASGGTGLTIVAPVGATTAGFDPATAETAANTAFTLTFDNQDNQAPHNLVLKNPDGTAVAVEGDTAFFTGPGQRVYQVPALAAGDYKYLCDVHPATMVGTLTAK
jgi:plastocyanin